MRVDIYLALMTACALPALLMYVSPRLAPKAAARCLAVGAVASATVWTGGLFILLVATVGRLPFLGQLPLVSHGAVEAQSPVPVFVGVVSLLALLAIAVTLPRAAVRLAQGVRDLRRLHTVCRKDAGDLTVIDSARPEAVALPGWRGHVIVTTAMLQALDSDERQVLLAHERSHMQGRHWLYRLSARLAAAVLPTTRPLVARCDQALERWADEDAAGLVGDRRLVATAVTKAAVAVGADRSPELAPSMAVGSTVHRVEALLQPPRTGSWLLIAVPLVAVLAVLILGAESASDLAALFDVPGVPGR